MEILKSKVGEIEPQPRNKQDWRSKARSKKFSLWPNKFEIGNKRRGNDLFFVHKQKKVFSLKTKNDLNRAEVYTILCTVLSSAATQVQTNWRKRSKSCFVAAKNGTCAKNGESVALGSSGLMIIEKTKNCSSSSNFRRKRLRCKCTEARVRFKLADKNLAVYQKDYRQDYPTRTMGQESVHWH